jgi:hypothetical protein
LDLLRPCIFRADADVKEVPDRRREKDWLSEKHFLLARIHYAPRKQVPREIDDFDQQTKEELGEDDQSAYLIYLKPSFDGDEENELKAHWASHPEFPHDPTTNQFYDEDMVESYRQLGYHIGEKICRQLFTPDLFDEGDAWSDNLFNIHEAVTQLAVRAMQEVASERGPKAPKPSSATPS